MVITQSQWSEYTVYSIGYTHITCVTEGQLVSVDAVADSVDSNCTR